MQRLWSLLLLLGVTYLVAAVGGAVTTLSIDGWYGGLVKPDLSPPDWVFGPVWSVLYTLIGVSAWLVWKKGVRDQVVRVAMVTFGVQLVLNLLWSVVFFGLQMLGLALAVIGLLWFSILAMILFFGMRSRLAAWLLVLYLLWVSFAAYLNFWIWRLN